MQAAAPESSARRQDIVATWPAFVGLAFACVILIAFRLHAFDLPLETDECNYAYIGSRLLAGDRLYADVWDHQPFGVFVLFASAIALFGDAPEVFRWMATGSSVVSLLLVYAIARRGTGPGAACTAAMLFALASSDPGTAGEGCNREIFMNTLVLAAWWLAMRRSPAGAWSTLAAGGAIGVASTLKTVVVVHWALLALWMALDTRRHAAIGLRTRQTLVSLALFAVAPACVWLAASAYFGLTERFGVFVDAVFLFNVSYADGSGGLLDRLGTFFSPPRHPFIFDSALPLWIGGVLASAWLAFDAAVRRDALAAAILLLGVAGFMAICLPGRFWPHYYALLVPVVVIAVPVVVGRLADRLHQSGRLRPRVARVSGGVLLAVFPLWLFNTEYDAYLSQPPFGITVNRYNSRDFWGRAHGENVRRVTEPGDEVFVYGNEAEFYYYARRRCASRYTMITAIHSGYAGHETHRTIMLEELKRRKPRLICVLFDEDPFDEWTAFLEEYYSAPIGWDYHDRTGELIMFVVARKDRPPTDRIDWNWDRSAVGGWFAGDKR